MLRLCAPTFKTRADSLNSAILKEIVDLVTTWLNLVERREYTVVLAPLFRNGTEYLLFFTSPREMDVQKKEGPLGQGRLKKF